MELTILMPCLNEEKTIAYCIDEASFFLSKSRISGEILVVDNGSCDQSVAIAKAKGARVIHVKKKGYGAALRTGIKLARGHYIICGDSDMSYDYMDCIKIYNKLLDGNALVVGNRFNNRMEKGAMPFFHQYFGVPLLSFLGRWKYHVTVRDFHCGLRGLKKDRMERVHFKTSGMEFATEMIASFAKEGLPIAQVDVHYRKDGRCGKSHLRTLRDGMRHLIFIMFLS